MNAVTSKVMAACLVLAGILCVTPAWAIDAWDAASITDGTAGSTRNYLNGPTGANVQVHDLEKAGGGVAEDWYIVEVEAGRSYAITIAGITGDVDMSSPDFLGRYDETGTTLLQIQGGDPNFRTLRWIAPSTGYNLVRVRGQPGASAASQYTIVAQASTYYCSRFNNAGTQISVMILQNTSTFACTYVATFQDEAGNALATDTTPLPGNATKVLALSSLPALVGAKGSVRIAHTCNARVFKGKVVALEPATGFSFDTPCEHRNS